MLKKIALLSLFIPIGANAFNLGQYGGPNKPQQNVGMSVNYDDQGNAYATMSGVNVPVDRASGAWAPPVKGASETFVANGRQGENYQAKRTICDPWNVITSVWKIYAGKDSKGNDIWNTVTQVDEMLESVGIPFYNSLQSMPPNKILLSKTRTPVRDDRELTIRNTRFTTGSRAGFIGGVYSGVTDGSSYAGLWGQQDQPWTWPQAFYPVNQLNAVLYPQIWTTMGGKLPSSYAGGTLATDAGGACNSICGYVPNMNSCHINISGKKVCGISTGGKGSYSIIAMIGSLPDGRLREYPVNKFEMTNKLSDEGKAHKFNVSGGSASSTYYGTFTKTEPTSGDRRQKSIDEEVKRDAAAKEKFVTWDKYDAFNAEQNRKMDHLAHDKMSASDRKLMSEFKDMTDRKSSITINRSADIAKDIADIEKMNIPAEEKQKMINSLKQMEQRLAAKDGGNKSVSDAVKYVGRENEGTQVGRTISLDNLRANRQVNTSYHLGAASLTGKMQEEAQEGSNSVIELYPVYCK